MFSAELGLISQGDAAVIAAAIGMVASVVVIQLKVHQDNRTDHGDTSQKIDRLSGKIDEVNTKVDHISQDLTDHLGWHISHEDES